MIFTDNRKIVGEINTYEDLVALIDKKSKNNLPFKNYDKVKDFFDDILSRKSIGVKHFIKEWRAFYSENYPNNGNKHVNYYLIRGYTEEESNEMVSRVQSSINKKGNRPEVIKKRVESWKRNTSKIKTQRGKEFYRLKGLSEEEINTKLQQRNDKWMKSLNEYVERTGEDLNKKKSCGFIVLSSLYGEEKANEIIKSRITNGRSGSISSIEKKYFEELGDGWKTQLVLKKDDGNVFLYDFYNETEKRIIEFQGDYWHCNPMKYKASYYHPQKRLYAKEIWDIDKYKKSVAESHGWMVEYVWETDYKLKTRIQSDYAIN